MLKSARNLIAAVALTLGVGQPAWATVQIVSPGADVAGQSRTLLGPGMVAVGYGRPPNPTIFRRPTIRFPLTIPLMTRAASMQARTTMARCSSSRAMRLLAASGRGQSQFPWGNRFFFPVLNAFYVPINSARHSTAPLRAERRSPWRAPLPSRPRIWSARTWRRRSTALRWILRRSSRSVRRAALTSR